MVKFFFSKKVAALAFGAPTGPVYESALVWVLPWAYSSSCSKRVRVLGTLHFHTK